MSNVFKDIRQKIADVIEAQSEKAAVVYRADRSSFDSYPAVIVVPSENATDWGDQSNQMYDITFIVRIHKDIPADGQEEAELILEEVVDELLDIFRDPDVLTPACDWVQPVPAAWGYQDRETGPVRTADLRLRCRKYINQ